MDGNPNNTFRMPAPIKQESECDIIDLDGPDKTAEEIVYEWDAKIRKQFSKHCVADNVWRLDVLMKEYLKSIQDEAINFEDTETLLRKMLSHIKYFNMYYSELNCCFIDNYLEIMEDILTSYCNIEMDVFMSKKKDMNKRETKRLLATVRRRIIHALTIYLLDKEDRIFHVLIKLKTGSSINRCTDIENAIYKHFLTKIPKDVSDEGFCRGYLLFQKWKAIRKPEERPGMDEILHKLYNKTPDTIKSNTTLKRILMPTPESALDLLTHVSGSTDLIAKEYFKYVKSKRITESEDEPFMNFTERDDEPVVRTLNEEEDDEFCRAYEEVVKNLSALSHSSEKETDSESLSQRCKQESVAEDDDVQIVSPDVVCEINDSDSDDILEVVYLAPKDHSKNNVKRRRPAKNTSFLDSIKIPSTSCNNRLGNSKISVANSPISTSSFLDSIRISPSDNSKSAATSILDNITVPSSVNSNSVASPSETISLNSELSGISINNSSSVGSSTIGSVFSTGVPTCASPVLESSVPTSVILPVLTSIITTSTTSCSTSTSALAGEVLKPPDLSLPPKLVDSGCMTSPVFDATQACMIADKSNPVENLRSITPPSKPMMCTASTNTEPIQVALSSPTVMDSSEKYDVINEREPQTLKINAEVQTVEKVNDLDEEQCTYHYGLDTPPSDQQADDHSVRSGESSCVYANIVRTHTDASESEHSNKDAEREMDFSPAFVELPEKSPNVNEDENDLTAPNDSLKGVESHDESELCFESDARKIITDYEANEPNRHDFDDYENQMTISEVRSDGSDHESINEIAPFLQSKADSLSESISSEANIDNDISKNKSLTYISSVELEITGSVEELVSSNNRPRLIDPCLNTNCDLNEELNNLDAVPEAGGTSKITDSPPETTLQGEEICIEDNMLDADEDFIDTGSADRCTESIEASRNFDYSPKLPLSDFVGLSGSISSTAIDPVPELFRNKQPKVNLPHFNETFNGSKSYALPPSPTKNVLAKELRVDIEKCDLNKDKRTPSPNKVMYTSPKKVKAASLADFSKFEQIMNAQWDKLRVQEFDDIFTGPVSKMNGMNYVYTCDDNFDLFDPERGATKNKNASTEQSNSRSNSPNDVSSPAFEAIDDFRTYFQRSSPKHQPLSSFALETFSGPILKKNGRLPETETKKKRVRFDPATEVVYASEPSYEIHDAYFLDTDDSGGSKRKQRNSVKLINGVPVNSKSLKAYNVRVSDWRLRSRAQVRCMKLTAGEILKWTRRDRARQGSGRLNVNAQESTIVQVVYDKRTTHLNENDVVRYNTAEGASVPGYQSFWSSNTNTSTTKNSAGWSTEDLTYGNWKTGKRKRNNQNSHSGSVPKRKPVYRKAQKSNVKNSQTKGSPRSNKQNLQVDLDKLLNSGAYSSRPFRLELNP